MITVLLPVFPAPDEPLGYSTLAGHCAALALRTVRSALPGCALVAATDRPELTAALEGGGASVLRLDPLGGEPHFLPRGTSALVRAVGDGPCLIVDFRNPRPPEDLLPLAAGHAANESHPALSARAAAEHPCQGRIFERIELDCGDEVLKPSRAVLDTDGPWHEHRAAVVSGAPWTAPPDGTRAQLPDGTPIAGRQDFPPLFTPDGTLAAAPSPTALLGAALPPRVTPLAIDATTSFPIHTRLDLIRARLLGVQLP